jgi:SAM-dependent methyltransferase
MAASLAPDASDRGRRLGAAPGEVQRCEWCAAPFDLAAARLSGRTRCGRCGAATTDPLPTEEELDRAYAGWYRPATGRFAGPLDGLLRRSRGRLASRLDQIAPEGPILDVGAGDGALLDALKARGRTTVGLERSPERPDVRSAEITEVEGPWSAVVFWHALEHLRNAGEALDHAVRILAPGGVMVIAMPNADSLQATVFGDRWLALDLPRHIVHVPARALLGRLRDLGLTTERVSYVRGGQAVFGWLHGLVGALPGRPDLYDAIRRPDARRGPMPPARRVSALTAGAILLPAAALCAAAEAAMRRGGSIYVEARRV